MSEEPVLELVSFRNVVFSTFAELFPEHRAIPAGTRLTQDGPGVNFRDAAGNWQFGRVVDNMVTSHGSVCVTPSMAERIRGTQP